MRILMGGIGLALALGLLGCFCWAMIAFRGFRIAVVILVIVAIGWAWTESEKAEEQRTKDDTAKKVKAAELQARQTELWSKVPASQVEMRNPVLRPGRFSDSEYEFTASIRNASSEQLGAFEMEITAFDCLQQRDCEIIGRALETVWVDIPSDQVRGVRGRINLYNMPQLRGKLVPRFAIKRVYAGNFLDEWGIREAQ